MLHKIFLVAHPAAAHPDTSALLFAVGRDRKPLDVVLMADRDNHVLFRDQILDLKLRVRVFDDVRASRVSVFLLQLEQFFFDNR